VDDCTPEDVTTLLRLSGRRTVNGWDVGFWGAEGGTVPVFSYEWQTMDLQEQECVRVANKGLKNRGFCKRVHKSEAGKAYVGSDEGVKQEALPRR
jgi:hypothetical protein